MQGMAIPIVVASVPVRGAWIEMPRHLSETLQIEPNTRVALRAGRKAVSCAVRISDDSGSVSTAPLLRLSPAIRRTLGLPLGTRLQIRRSADSLEVGPFFGIFARYERRWPPYGEQNVDFRAHMEAGRQRHVAVYTFGPRDIDWNRRLIRALIYDTSGTRNRWRRVYMAMPHVVWNRSYWPGAHRRVMKATLRRLRLRAGSMIFNAGVGTKWHVYRHLWEQESLRPHLPRTARYRGIGTVLRFLARYPGVYMKPVWGGWGIGVFRIRRVGRNRFTISRTLGRRGVNVSRTVGLQGLRAELARLVRKPYLVQQEIRLARIGDRIVDIRVLAQRRSDGSWGITGAVARAGRRRSVISNLHGGGRPIALAQAAPKIFPNNPEIGAAAEATIHRLTHEIIAVIERKYGRFGEIGLDFGIDQTGHVWFIEVNSRPGKNSFRITSRDNAWRAATANPVEYANQLSRFQLETSRG